jgi:hypothetical protein
MMVEVVAVGSEAELVPNHSEPPIYIPALKSFLTFGHFVIIDAKRSDGVHERIVGQLLHHHDPNNVVVCVLLPLYHDATLQHINTPSILPQCITDASCVNVVELVNISKVAVVPVESINSLAFVFLASDVMNYTFHVQGMSDAFVIRFCQSLISNTLVQLNNDCFFEFLDLYPEHQLRYCDCFGRSIFSH